MKFDAVIQARISSKRLPGKVLMQVNKKPMLLYLVNRLRHIKKINKIIISTSRSAEDNKIVEFCNKQNLYYYRGDKNNCAKRILNTIKEFDLKNIVFITGDCPIIDIKIINRAINYFITRKYDYVGNSFIRSYPDGMDVHVFSQKLFSNAYKLIKTKLEKEHVTLSIKNNKKKFKIFNFKAPKKLFYPDVGLTLDEIYDFKLIKKIILYFNKQKKTLFSCKDILNLILTKRSWLEINKNVKRKGET